MMSLLLRRGTWTQRDTRDGLTEEGAISEPRKEASGETKLADTLILDFLPFM